MLFILLQFCKFFFVDFETTTENPSLLSLGWAKFESEPNGCWTSSSLLSILSSELVLIGQPVTGISTLKEWPIIKEMPASSPIYVTGAGDLTPLSTAGDAIEKTFGLLWKCTGSKWKDIQTGATDDSAVGWKSWDHLNMCIGNSGINHISFKHSRWKSSSRLSRIRICLLSISPIDASAFRSIDAKTLRMMSIEGLPWENFPTKENLKGSARWGKPFAEKKMAGSPLNELGFLIETNGFIKGAQPIIAAKDFISAVEGFLIGKWTPMESIRLFRISPIRVVVMI